MVSACMDLASMHRNACDKSVFPAPGRNSATERPPLSEDSKHIQHERKSGTFPKTNGQCSSRISNGQRISGKFTLFIITSCHRQIAFPQFKFLQLAVRELRHGHVQYNVSASSWARQSPGDCYPAWVPFLPRAAYWRWYLRSKCQCNSHLPPASRRFRRASSDWYSAGRRNPFLFSSRWQSPCPLPAWHCTYPVPTAHPKTRSHPFLRFFQATAEGKMMPSFTMLIKTGKRFTP